MQSGTKETVGTCECGRNAGYTVEQYPGASSGASACYYAAPDKSGDSCYRCAVEEAVRRTTETQ